MARPAPYGPLPPHVDASAEQARRELLDALAVAFPRSEGHSDPTFDGNARQEVLAALQSTFPRGGSSGPTITELAQNETHNTDGKAAQLDHGDLADSGIGNSENAPADSTSAAPEADVEAEDTDDTAASKGIAPSPEQLQKGLDKLTYLSSQSVEARVAWIVKKAEQLRQDGNKLFGQGDWGAASAKYRSVLDLLGERSAFPEEVQKTHDDLTVLCASNLAACALKAEDAEEVLRLSEVVLAIEPGHMKARFRRAIAQVRRNRSGRTEAMPTKEDDACSLRWAAPRSQGSSTATGSRDAGAVANDGAAKTVMRAAELLEAQQELEAMCRSKAKDKTVRKAVEELYQRATAEHIHLRPPAWLFPKGMRDFEYRHCPGLADNKANQEPPALSLGPAEGNALCGPGLERNLLIFLHGFGGRKDSFAALAETLKLPKTAVLIFNAPNELPGELLDDPPGFSWFTMLDHDTLDFIQPHPQEMRRVSSLGRSVELLSDVLRTLVSSLAWAASEIFLFGYGQGGSVALDMLINPGPSASLGCLGGVVGVATEILPERLCQNRQTRVAFPAAADAPGILLLHGAQDELTSTDAAEASAEFLRGLVGDENVQLHVFRNRGGEMLRGGSAEETLCLMEFLSDRLHGVGRRGSEEAMAKLGAEPVVFAECCGEPAANLQELD